MTLPSSKRSLTPLITFRLNTWSGRRFHHTESITATPENVGFHRCEPRTAHNTYARRLIRHHRATTWLAQQLSVLFQAPVLESCLPECLEPPLPFFFLVFCTGFLPARVPANRFVFFPFAACKAFSQALWRAQRWSLKRWSKSVAIRILFSTLSALRDISAHLLILHLAPVSMRDCASVKYVSVSLMASFKRQRGVMRADVEDFKAIAFDQNRKLQWPELSSTPGRRVH